MSPPSHSSYFAFHQPSTFLPRRPFPLRTAMASRKRNPSALIWSKLMAGSGAGLGSRQSNSRTYLKNVGCFIFSSTSPPAIHVRPLHLADYLSVPVPVPHRPALVPRLLALPLFSYENLRCRQSAGASPLFRLTRRWKYRPECEATFKDWVLEWFNRLKAAPELDDSKIAVFCRMFCGAYYHVRPEN